MRMLLIRHAQSSANAEGRMQGRLDVSLSEQGRAQSARLADHLETLAVDAIYTSPLLRARETAEVIGVRIALPIIERPGLMERDVGVLAGLTRDEIIARFPQFATARRAGAPVEVEGFELDNAFAERVRAAFDDITTSQAGEAVAVVTHGGVIGSFLRQTLGIPLGRAGPFAIDNASVTTFDLLAAADGAPHARTQLIGLNDTCHLDGLRG